MTTHNVLISANKPLLKASDISEILNISKSKVYQMMQSNELPTIKVGSCIRVHPDDLVTYLNRHTQEPGE